MKFEVLVSESAASQLRKLEDADKARIKQRISLLSEDPFRPRPLADIKKLKGFSNPALYRLHVGDFRVIYTIEEKAVKITEIFRRSKGYAWLE